MDFDVVDLPATDHVTTGETAPDFTRPLVHTEYWEDTALTTILEEGPVVLVFHPMDGGFPALYMWQALTDRTWPGETQLVGISISTPYEHKQFLRDRNLGSVRLFSDPAADVADLYGLTHDLDGMAGITEHRPAVVVIDTDQHITHTWVASEWPSFPEYEAIEAAVVEL